MAILIKVRDTPKGQEQIPIWIPDWYAYQRNLAYVERQIKKMARIPEPEEEKDKRLKDTKPTFVVDRSELGRTIISVGAGEVWREDLKDMGRRAKERPDPRKNPKLAKTHQQMQNDIDRKVFMGLRAKRGAFTVHIKNNPLAKGEP